MYGNNVSYVYRISLKGTSIKLLDRANSWFNGVWSSVLQFNPPDKHPTFRPLVF